MRRTALSGLFLATVLAFAGTAAAQNVEPALVELLAASDLFARAPAEFRTEIEVRPVGAKESGRLELFRNGADRELVRFLAPKETGKFLLRRGNELYLLAPGSRRPVRLASSHRVYGAAIHDLVGMDLVRDYRIERAAAAAGVVTFDLVASVPDAAAPRLRWVVSRETGRPLRAELRSSQGKAMRVEPGAKRARITAKPRRAAIRGTRGSYQRKDLRAKKRR